MKVTLISSLMLLTLVSCGNPHISSSRGGLERTNAPLTDQLCSPDKVVTEFEFFSETDSAIPEIYSTTAKCKKTVTETFNSYNDGEIDIASNEESAPVYYELRHQVETYPPQEKVLYLDDFFGAEIFSMIIENPINHDGFTGLDRGLDSTEVNTEERDALIWSFSSPISAFGAKTVGFISHASSTMKLFDCDRILIKKFHISGNVGFTGFLSPEKNICYASITAGSNEQSIALDEFFYSY